MSTPVVISAKRLIGIIGGGWSSPIFESLAAAISAAIADGRLPVGMRLPSERAFADAADLSRTTTSRTYARLREQGFLRTRRGSGSLVQLPSVPGGRIDHLLTPAGSEETEIDLTCTAQVATPALVSAYERALSKLGAYLPGSGYYPSGLPVLRELIADRFTDRGVATDPEQILITSGALSSVAFAIRGLLQESTSPGSNAPGTRAGSRVLIESPSYPNAIATLEAAGARLVSAPLALGTESHHWDIEAMDQLMGQVRVSAAYLIPDFHNPTGALMPEDQRVALGEALGRHGVVPIIDESLVELGLEAAVRPAPLAAWVPDSITVGSTSKIFWGGLRIGWMRIPRRRIDQMAAARLSLDLGAPVLEQLAAVELLADHDALIAEHRTRLRTARDSLAAQVSAQLPDWQFTVPRGGMALWVRLPAERSGALAMTARRCGLGLVSGPNFAPTGGLDGWIRLPYTAPEHQLAQVGQRLAAAWEEAKTMPLRDRPGRPRIVA